VLNYSKTAYSNENIREYNLKNGYWGKGGKPYKREMKNLREATKQLQRHPE
jgi:hypothetical protein